LLLLLLTLLCCKLLPLLNRCLMLLLVHCQGSRLQENSDPLLINRDPW
jgi:hypothetical protein